MYFRKSLGKKIFDIINTIFLVLVSLACLAPFLHTLFASISDPTNLARHQGIVLMPMGINLKGYSLVFKNPNILNSYLNTLIYVTAATSLNILLTSFGAYACSRKKLLWQNVIMFMITFTMFFNGGLIPFYLLVKGLGLIDNRLAMIIPSAISAWNLIIMRTGFASIPDSLEESAKIDGANDFTVLFKIYFPLCKAVIAVITLFYMVGHWNSWFSALIFLRDRKLYPLQLVLREILVQNDTSKVMLMADVNNELDLYKPLVKYTAVIISTIPILCIYPFVQKYFVTGIMIGSIKG